MDVDLSDYYSGGYYLVKAKQFPKWDSVGVDVSIMPEKVVSVSQCICDILDIVWGVRPRKREAALKFGIPEDKFEAFSVWCNHEWETQLNFPKMFRTLEEARAMVKQFSIDKTDLYLISPGLRKELETAQWHEPTDQFKIVQAYIEEHLSLESGGIPLGYEVLSFSNGLMAHSWLCNGYWNDMHQLFGIRPNQYGQFDTYSEAKKVYDWLWEDDERGEPEPYLVWLLMSYPLTAES